MKAWLKSNGKKKDRQPGRGPSGQSMVEFSVGLVILLILLAGVVDLGRMAFYYLSMRDAAEEGASYGSIFPNNNQEIISRALSGAVDSSRVEVQIKIKKASSTYECSSKNACANYVDTCAGNTVVVGDVIEIKVIDPDFPITMPFLGTFLGKQSIHLEAVIQNPVVRVPACE